MPEGMVSVLGVYPRTFMKAANQTLPEMMMSVLDRLAGGESFNQVCKESGITGLVQAALQAQTEKVYCLVQEGGSSKELYLLVHATCEKAQAVRVSCAREGAYRTSSIVEVPRSLAHADGFYDAVEALVLASHALERVPVPDELDADEDLLSVSLTTTGPVQTFV